MLIPNLTPRPALRPVRRLLLLFLSDRLKLIHCHRARSVVVSRPRRSRRRASSPSLESRFVSRQTRRGRDRPSSHRLPSLARSPRLARPSAPSRRTHCLTTDRSRDRRRRRTRRGRRRSLARRARSSARAPSRTSSFAVRARVTRRVDFFLGGASESSDAGGGARACAAARARARA